MDLHDLISGFFAPHMDEIVQFIEDELLEELVTLIMDKINDPQLLLRKHEILQEVMDYMHLNAKRISNNAVSN